MTRRASCSSNVSIAGYSNVYSFVETGASVGEDSVIILPVNNPNLAMVKAGSAITRGVQNHAIVLRNLAGFVGWIDFPGEELVDADKTWMTEEAGIRLTANEFGLELNVY